MPLTSLWRVRDRATFRALRHSRHRARRGALTVTWLPPAYDGAPPRAAFAVPSRIGAVARNRIRRRLRAALAATGPLSGTLLVTAGSDAASVSWERLRTDLTAALRAVGALAERSGP